MTQNSQISKKKLIQTFFCHFLSFPFGIFDISIFLTVHQILISVCALKKTDYFVCWKLRERTNPLLCSSNVGICLWFILFDFFFFFSSLLFLDTLFSYRAHSDDACVCVWLLCICGIYAEYVYSMCTLKFIDWIPCEFLFKKFIETKSSLSRIGFTAITHNNSHFHYQIHHHGCIKARTPQKQNTKMDFTKKKFLFVFVVRFFFSLSESSSEPVNYAKLFNRN